MMRACGNITRFWTQAKCKQRSLLGESPGEILVNQQNGEHDNSKTHTKIPTNRNTIHIPSGSSVSSWRVLTARSEPRVLIEYPIIDFKREALVNEHYSVRLHATPDEEPDEGNRVTLH
jgi:hypothetical protein